MSFRYSRIAQAFATSFRYSRIAKAFAVSFRYSRIAKALAVSFRYFRIAKAHAMPHLCAKAIAGALIRAAPVMSFTDLTRRALGCLLIPLLLAIPSVGRPASTFDDAAIAPATQTPSDLISQSAGGQQADTTIPTLRIDNYVDVIDSVLNAGSGIAVVEEPARVSTSSAPAFDRIQTDTKDSSPLDESRMTQKRLIMRADDRGVLATRAVQSVDEPLVVTSDVPFLANGAINWPMPTGRHSIVAADGSRIELDADNGDEHSVTVTIEHGGERYQVREPWSSWLRVSSAQRR